MNSSHPAKNPLVLGLGFAAVRDAVSFLRYKMKDKTGNRNPVAFGKKETGIKKGIHGWGRLITRQVPQKISVYYGFNEDESHRKVFDAICPYVAGGGRTFLNYEFGRPVTSCQQHSAQLDPELFPFAYNVIRDPQTGAEKDGILKRPKTDPYVMHVQTSTEYRQKRGALVHTDGKGRDIPYSRQGADLCDCQCIAPLSYRLHTEEIEFAEFYQSALSQ